MDDAGKRERVLPKWAQWKFEALQREVEYLREENQVLRGEYPKSNIALMRLGRGSLGLSEMWLPERDYIRFFLKASKDYPDGFHVDCYVRNGELNVMGESSIVILPSASNVVNIVSAR